MVTFDDAVSSLASSKLPLVCVDTCIWLDFLRGRFNSSRARDGIEKLRCFNNKDFRIVVPSQVLVEYNRNKGGRMAEYASILKGISSDFNKYLEDIKERNFPGLTTLREDYMDFIKNTYESSVNKLFDAIIVYKVTEDMYKKGAIRSCERLGPAARRGSSAADSVIVESFIELVDKLRSLGFQLTSYFLTSNTNDFSDPRNKELIHPDLKDEFNNKNINYFSDFLRFINLGKY